MSIDFLDVHTITQCRFTLTYVYGMIKTHSRHKVLKNTEFPMNFFYNGKPVKANFSVLMILALARFSKYFKTILQNFLIAKV